jgi:hypothetical protein
VFDCDGGDCDDGCGCGEPGPSGCDNVCGSDAILDECGECGGDSSSCEDCAGVPNGDAVDDCADDGDCLSASWVGDGWCDGADQAWGADLTCYDCDGGDCEMACGCDDATSCLDCCDVANGDNSSCGGSGDVNGDGSVDVTDVVAVIAHVLATALLDECGINESDLNGDGTVNILDVVGLVEIILAGSADDGGDDGSEYEETRDEYSNSGTWKINSFDDDSGDDACCTATNCVYNSVCYNSYTYVTGVGSGADNRVVCHSDGRWLDCDGDSGRCGQCGLSWLSTGDGSIGEYNTQGHLSDSCCGDDAGEFARTSGATHGSSRCCSSGSDCVDSGNTCRANGYEYASGNDWYECSSGTWSDIGCSQSSDCSSGYYCDEGSHSCVDLPTCAEANSGYSYN